MRFIAFIFMVTFSFLNANPFKQIKTFQADFIQSIVNNSNKEIKYSGKIYIKEPYLVLWRYDDPQKDVYINNQLVTIVEPELEQAIITKLKNEINMVKLLQDATKVSKDIYQTELYNIVYTIKLEDRKLKSINYKDELENQVKISFLNSIENQDIQNSTFEANIPNDYDIIRK